MEDLISAILYLSFYGSAGIASSLLGLGVLLFRKPGKGEKEESKPPSDTDAKEKEEFEPPEGFFARLRAGLSKTQGQFTKRLERILVPGRKIEPEIFEELEEVLITSDLGVNTTTALLEKLRRQVEKREIEDLQSLRGKLREELERILKEVENPLDIPDQDRPFVLMVTGVNGTGKTTTIGKLAMRFRHQGKSVLIAASDTFRAAAIEQLEIWAERAGAPVIKHRQGADPSAVAFDAIRAAKSRGADVLIVDTAGRLHTKVNLMDELKKVKRIIARELAGAPDEIMLVLDATTGQNAIQQARMFHEALGITGIVLTKLDGTAKGGIVIAVSDEFNIPLRFIGVGEKIYDLQEFNAGNFIHALLD
jgi:fused signal recognition particle receptor